MARIGSMNPSGIDDPRPRGEEAVTERRYPKLRFVSLALPLIAVAAAFLAMLVFGLFVATFLILDTYAGE
jgi:hypothetical protein